MAGMQPVLNNLVNCQLTVYAELAPAHSTPQVLRDLCRVRTLGTHASTRLLILVELGVVVTTANTWTGAH